MTISLSTSILGALRCFEAAARHMSFTRAALELNLTTGAISQQIRQLEDRLGYLLFNRLGRGITLTPEGQALSGSVANAFSHIGEAIAELRKASGPLLLSCSPSFAMLWLMPRLLRFRKDNPAIGIKLVAEFQSVDRSSLRVGSIDAAIRYDTTTYSGVQVTRLMDEYLLPVATSRYLQFQTQALTRPGFVGATLLHDDSPWDGAEARAEWQAWLNAAHGAQAINPNEQEFNLFMLALSAAKNHHGICIGRSALILEDIRSESLINFSHRPELSPASYKLLTTRPEDPRVIALTSWLELECRKTEVLREDTLRISTGHKR
jgi:DNA-binding transcriptional LysR family regulator